MCLYHIKKGLNLSNELFFYSPLYTMSISEIFLIRDFIESEIKIDGDDWDD
jgi:hypothetical protein